MMFGLPRQGSQVRWGKSHDGKFVGPVWSRPHEFIGLIDRPYRWNALPNPGVWPTKVTQEVRRFSNFH